MKKSSPFYRTRQMFSYALFEKFFKQKIASINNIMCASTPSILNPTIYITHHIDSLSTFTIPSLYEVNYLHMKSQCTSPTALLPLSLYNRDVHGSQLLCFETVSKPESTVSIPTIF